MKSIISKYFILSTLLLLSFTTYAVAEPALPTSTQVSDSNDLPKSKQATKAVEEEEIEIVPEIKIDTQSSASNPKLKEGKACDYDDLEEIKGELFTEIPMAKTIPCDKVDCSDLKPARMLRDNYKKLPIAKTISCGSK